MLDARLGRAARALRHRLRLRQRDVADRAGLSHDLVSRLERGRIDGMTVGSVRRMLAVFDAEVLLQVRWRGGELDRLIDRDHASLADLAVAWLERHGWTVLPEVSFNVFGDRGSIDLLAWHAAARIVLVVELKAALISVEETVRRLDVKARIAVQLAKERFGERPVVVCRLLILPDGATPRRHVSRHALVLARAFPDRGSRLRAWLREPSARAISGLLFLSSADGARTIHSSTPVRRVRRPTSGDPKRPIPRLRTPSDAEGDVVKRHGPPLDRSHTSGG